ncbi:hypothetical protein FRB96_005220 [Tulasnella sp. 330]|nr:hypothetical protein FRB96_005220 [Tulasnella sp. 330]
MTTPLPATQTLCFGYGSNIWLQQMRQRCPESTYLGVARLPSYRWIINERGYANVVHCVGATSPNLSESILGYEAEEYEVYGLVYALSTSDEARLDINEGVPLSYEKEYLKVQFWPSSGGEVWVDVTKGAVEREVLVYVNEKAVTDSAPKAEYVYRMNMAIKDGLKMGIPGEYVRKVMRKFIPEMEDESLKEVAGKQALLFQDEI